MSLDTISLPDSGLRWLYVDFNSYFASVEQELSPELRGKPVAVVPVDTDSTSAIAASYEAKAFGVKTGTPVWQAKKMCPGLVCVVARHDHYVEFHNRIVREVERHIPVTAVCSIDEVACRLMDNETPIERRTEIARSIKKGLPIAYTGYGQQQRSRAGAARPLSIHVELPANRTSTILHSHHLDEVPELRDLQPVEVSGVGARHPSFIS